MIVNILRNLNLGIGIIIALVLSISVGFIFKIVGINNNLSAIASGTSFLFSVFISFSISRSHDRLNKINEILKADEANLFVIYKMSGVFGKDIQDKVRKLLDDYLIDQIDYYLQDFKYSNKSFQNLYSFIIELDPKTDRERTAFTLLVNTLANSANNRKKVETFVLEKVLKSEWLIIISLLILEIFFIFDANSGNILSIIMSSILSAATIALVLVLKDLDSLKRDDEKWIWEPLHNLFLSLDLLPYYPDGILKYKEAKIKIKSKIRLATYPNKYPDMTGKKIEEIEYGSE